MFKHIQLSTHLLFDQLLVQGSYSDHPFFSSVNLSVCLFVNFLHVWLLWNHIFVVFGPLRYSFNSGGYNFWWVYFHSKRLTCHFINFLEVNVLKQKTKTSALHVQDGKLERPILTSHTLIFLTTWYKTLISSGT